MKTLIIGSGTAGGLIGARLVERGMDVTFLVRQHRHRQLITTGLTLLSPYGRFRRPVTAVTPDELSGVFDLIVIATRAQDYEAVLQLVVASVGPETLVVPVVEGAAHVQAELIPNGGRLIGAVLEARVQLDADGVLTQRMPTAELQIGAMEGYDADAAEQLAEFLGGRGLATIVTDRIEAAIWERFCFTAGAVAVNALTGMSLRDAVRPTHYLTVFDRVLNEGLVVGQAIGLAPRPERALRYRSAFRMESRPVQPPAVLSTPGRAGDEAAHLLIEMVAIAERAGVSVPRLRAARDILVRPRQLTLSAIDVSADQA